MQPQFQRLKIIKRSEQTSDSFSLTFQVPEPLRSEFMFVPGQYLTLRRCEPNASNQSIRRSYSICSSRAEYVRSGQISIGIKRVAGGEFTEPAYAELKANEFLDVLPPEGRFTLKPEECDVHHVAFAAGSGITPILSILDAVLHGSTLSRFTLVYGNRTSNQVMFLEAIEGLKNKYLDRLHIIYVLSSQPQEIDLFNGRIDSAKVSTLLSTLIPANKIDVAWLCGPDVMIDQTEEALRAGGVPAQSIRSERFGQPRAKSKERVPVEKNSVPSAKLVVMLDGKAKTLAFPFAGDSLLDVALQAGMDLPYACKGGVCCTCRAKVLSGEVKMDKNFTLEKWEVDKGFVLTCQCLPLTAEVTVSYDER
jgi:ring-1,2-phenylacetyl-CoA epoxidase subunit PaaE